MLDRAISPGRRGPWSGRLRLPRNEKAARCEGAGLARLLPARHRPVPRQPPGCTAARRLLTGSHPNLMAVAEPRIGLPQRPAAAPRLACPAAFDSKPPIQQHSAMPEWQACTGRPEPQPSRFGRQPVVRCTPARPVTACREVTLTLGT